MTQLCNAMSLSSGVFFVSSWKTDNAGTSSSTQITVPTTSAGTYNCIVDWGDGSSSVITTYDDAAWTHTYAGSGTYTVKISGTFTGIQFNNGGDRLKLLNISKWGKMRLGNTGAYFYGCANLTITATDILDLTGTTTFISAFAACTSLTTIPSANSWNTSSITSLNLAFYLSASFNQNISSWDTSSVTNFASVFWDCAAFNQNISSWNTSAATTLAGMFVGCVAFNQNISSWVTSSVASMVNTFNGATSFNQNLGSWNITALTNATTMFANVTLSTTNYNALLDGWGAQVAQNSVTFSGGNSHYDTTTGGFNGTAGRLVLTATRLWTITDGGTP
jgi:surface protein